MNSVFGTSVSGLRAATKHVEASASNIANMRNQFRVEDADLRDGGAAREAGGATAEPDPKVFRPVRVDQQSVEPGGVKADFSEINPPHRLAYDPSSPVDSEDGVVAMPNVELENEFVNLMMAQRAYEANLQPIKAQDEMLGELLNTKT